MIFYSIRRFFFAANTRDVLKKQIFPASYIFLRGSISLIKVTSKSKAHMTEAETKNSYLPTPRELQRAKLPLAAKAEGVFAISYLDDLDLSFQLSEAANDTPLNFCSYWSLESSHNVLVPHIDIVIISEGLFEKLNFPVFESLRKKLFSCPVFVLSANSGGEDTAVGESSTPITYIDISRKSASDMIKEILFTLEPKASQN